MKAYSATFCLLTAVMLGEIAIAVADDSSPKLSSSPFDDKMAAANQQAWAKHLNAEVEIVNSRGMRFRLIPPGEFQMGSPASDRGSEKDEKQHAVRISKAFYLGKHEVTRGEFRRFVELTNYKTEAERDGNGGGGYTHDQKAPYAQKPEYTWMNTGYKQTDDHPVVNVSWNDATEYCKWLSRAEGRMYRLPTEAEWEYACRAGTTSRWSGGNEEKDLEPIANIADASLKASYPDVSWAKPWNDEAPFTAPVGRFRSNHFSLHDMHGNVYEWCQDWYGDKYYETSPQEDPRGPVTGKNRVLRGGTWFFDANFARAANRNSIPQDDRGFNIGFRVATEVPASGKTDKK